MLHPKQHITDLSEICFRQGIKHIVISPGSRNAPLIDSFFLKFGEQCISIVDERSAGYFALGLAHYDKIPVVLICTSGTAVLNYGPALAEAYYAHVPLLAITADRPAELIDQQDNQTIRQREVFRNFVKKSFHLPEHIDSQDLLRKTHRQILEAIGHTLLPCAGPVHINVPLHEPLYETLPSVSADIDLDSYHYILRDTDIPDKLISQWQNARRIMIIHGHDYPDTGLTDSLAKLAKDTRITIIAENISNVCGKGIISNPELIFTLSAKSLPGYPELLIYSGGQIVSKRLKHYLRAARNLTAWRIGIDDYSMDTFKQSNIILPVRAEVFYRKLTEFTAENTTGGYKDEWYNAFHVALETRDRLLDQVPFSDLTAIQSVLEHVPSGSLVELGNSTPIRYAQNFDSIKEVQYFSNRGVSGIDGCLSSAAGAAFASKRLAIAIIGDLSFVYDSNALWNRKLPSNLRIVVINNRGGGIFNLLDGPSTKAAFTDYIEAAHPVNIQKLAEAFNLDYFCTDEHNELNSMLPVFMEQSGRTKIMEIRTGTENNKRAFNLIFGKNTE
jgi:2-succinyl-5-enolpyruvyl-6-hydroxy-3-cyclohexene-1-carboxylate synthase